MRQTDKTTAVAALVRDAYRAESINGIESNGPSLELQTLWEALSYTDALAALLNIIEDWEDHCYE